MGMMQDFQKADEERRREIKQLQHNGAKMRSEVATMLKDFARADSERASEVASYTHSEVAKIRLEAGKIRSEATTMLKDFTKGDRERASEVTGYLHSEVASICSEVATMLKDFAKADRERASEVTNFMHSEVARIRSEAEAIGEAVWGEAPDKKLIVSPVEKSVVRETPIGELRDRVFVYLANHPDGTKLSELEEKIGAARIQAARVIRELMDENKVEKRDLLYFAI